MKQEQPKNGRKLIYVIMVLLGLMAGCAAAPELTPEQVTQINVLCKDNATCVIDETNDAMRRLYEQLEYEREDRLIKRRDECILFLNACDTAESLVVVEIIKSGRSQLPTDRQKRRARSEYGYAYTHDNVGKWARKSDFLCMSPRDVMRSLGY